MKPCINESLFYSAQTFPNIYMLMSVIKSGGNSEILVDI